LIICLINNDNALLAYLGAARAAQQQDAHDRRDKYLRLAHETTPSADTAISLTKAELQLSHKQYEQALATLSILAQQAPKHAYVLKLLAITYQKLNDWNNLKQLIPDIKKYSALSTEKVWRLELTTWQGVLNDTANSSNVKTLMQQWNDVPRHIKADSRLIKHYARLLLKLDAAGEAEQFLRQSLSNNWDDSVIELYAELDVMADNKQLETVESWLQANPSNAHLLLVLGNICTSRSLWGKARNYYEASLAVSPMPEAYLQLARLLEEHMHEQAAAQEYYRQGLHLLVGEYNESGAGRDAITPRLAAVKPALKVV
jgi:HemY protein